MLAAPLTQLLPNQAPPMASLRQPRRPVGIAKPGTSLTCSHLPSPQLIPNQAPTAGRYKSMLPRSSWGMSGALVLMRAMLACVAGSRVISSTCHVAVAAAARRGSA